MEAVADALEREWFFVNSTRPFALVVASMSVAEALGDALAQLLLRRGNVLLGVQDLDYGGFHANQHIVVADVRRWNITNVQGGSVAFHNSCAHETSDLIPSSSDLRENSSPTLDMSQIRGTRLPARTVS